MGVQQVDTDAARTTAQGPATSDSDPQWTEAILPYANSGAHFMSDMRELRNFTAAAVRAWGNQQFFGPSINQWPQWTTVGGIGGWTGLAKLGSKIRIEVGSVRWRAEGWVSLRAIAQNATVQTVPVALTELTTSSSTVGSSHARCGTSSGRVGASINLRGSAVIEVLDADGEAVAGFSGVGAARLMDKDDVPSLTNNYYLGGLCVSQIFK